MRYIGTWLCTLILILGSHVHAQRDAKVPDPDPELERKALQLAPGFEINLFAADPLLAKPTQMNFDAAGRLWVATSEVYPQIKPGQKANDKIIILEDTDGDGRADKTTVFADGLLIPTGVEPGDGGAYVADSTDLLFLQDSDGDGKADRRRIVLSGFGTEDTHHILHTLRWGHDGMLYFNQSIYIHSHIETPFGVRRLGGGGIWQFRPETNRLEVFARGWWNSWGHHFDRWGQSFVTDGAGGEGINYAIPGASYTATPGAARVLQGLNPGHPKYCGEELLSGRHLPEDWRGSIITNDFRAHRVCRFTLTPDGSGYTAQQQADLIKTNHPGFRPIDVKMGPDGAIYIADWYNPIIQHGEVDFRDPRRDHVHGRIWRITAKDRPLVKQPRLVGASTEALLAALKEPEDWTRHHAKRVLKERGKKVLPELAAWVKNLDAADADHEHHLLEALWTYQALDVVEPTLLGRLLHGRDHRARAAATRVLSAWHDRLPHPLELLADRVADDHPQVRLEAVRALGQVPNARAAEIAALALDRPLDKFLDYSLWLTLRELEGQWMPAFQKGSLDFGNERRLLFALQAVGSRTALAPLVDMMRSGKVAKDREEGVLTLIAALGGPQELGMVFERTGAGVSQATLLAALEKASRERGVRPEGDLTKRLGALLNAEDDAVRAAAARLTGLWRLEALRARLLELARDPKSGDALRQSSFEGLTLLGGPASREAFEQLSSGDRPFAVRRQALVAWTALEVDGAARRAIEVLANVKDGEDPTDVFSAFLERKGGAAALTAALKDHDLPADVAKMGVRTARTSGRDAPALVEALTKAGKLSNVLRALSAKELTELQSAISKDGDAARGEAVFRRKDQACLKCHAIAGAGGQVGPDLASIGASAPLDYLIESLLQPNKAIKENYHAMNVVTRDGKLISGIKVRETKTELVLRNAEDREVVIPAKDIEDKGMGGSLMPEGLIDPLTRGELVDLVRFLSELGKVGPYAVSKSRLVRRWQVLEATPAAQALVQRSGLAALAGSDPALTWGGAYSQVAGTLPIDSLPHVQLDKQALGVVRCQVDVTTAGKVKLLLNAVDGIQLWLDGVSVPADQEMTLDLATGLRTLTIAVDTGKRRLPLRVELEDAANSGARARIVGGK